MCIRDSITAESEKLDPLTLQEMCLAIRSLATIYLKPIKSVFRTARPRTTQDSPALQKDRLPSREDALLARASMIQQQAMNGTGGSNEGANGDLPSAVDAADMYFAGVNSQQMAQLSVNDHDGYGYGDGGLMSPGSGPGETMFVVSQNQPQQVYRPVAGQGNGDLLML